MTTQPGSRWMGIGAAILLAAGAMVYFGFARGPAVHWADQADPPALARQPVSTSITPDASIELISAGLERGDGMALAVLLKRLTPAEGEVIEPVQESESQLWSNTLRSLRNAYRRFAPYGRGSAAAAAGRMLKKYAETPAPDDWDAVLGPAFDIFSAAARDADPNVRSVAVQELGRIWSWSPGRDLFVTELDMLAAWKESLYKICLGALEDPEPLVRASAVAALGALPLVDQAAPALVALSDRSPEVRGQVLVSFQDRGDVLNEESVLPLLYDSAPTVAQMAERLLRTRGLTPDQIGLGKMVVHPQQKIRLAAIPLLQERTDIDPTLWLVYLSRDRDESVRASAVEALSKSNAPEARVRLQEIAERDQSAEIRAAAAKVTGELAAETTAALPPLPGSSRLNPKAN